MPDESSPDRMAIFWEGFRRRARPHRQTLLGYAAILVLAIGIVAACLAWMVIAR